MTGYDVLSWFSDLWYDLTHLGSASMPEVGFKLVVLFFGFLIAKAILGMIWRVLFVETLNPIITPILRVVFFPIRAPFMWWRSWRDQRQRKRDNQRWQQHRAAQEREQQAQADAERLRQEQAQIAELVRLQRATRID